MKLKDEYVLYEAREDEMIAVATGSEAKHFKGLIRTNESASFIMNCLKEDTTVEEILNKMKEEYDADDEILLRDINIVIEKLKSIDALV